MINLRQVHSKAKLSHRKYVMRLPKVQFCRHKMFKFGRFLFSIISVWFKILNFLYDHLLKQQTEHPLCWTTSPTRSVNWRLIRMTPSCGMWSRLWNLSRGTSLNPCRPIQPRVWIRYSGRILLGTGFGRFRCSPNISTEIRPPFLRLRLVLFKETGLFFLGLNHKLRTAKNNNQRSHQKLSRFFSEILKFHQLFFISIR